MTEPEIWEDPDMLAHDPDRDMPPLEELEPGEDPDSDAHDPDKHIDEMINPPCRLGFIGEIILAFSAVAITWFLISTVLFLGYIAFGICVCMLSPEAAICAETIGDIFQFFYFDSWISMLNPATWTVGFQ